MKAIYYVAYTTRRNPRRDDWQLNQIETLIAAKAEGLRLLTREGQKGVAWIGCLDSNGVIYPLYRHSGKTPRWVSVGVEQ